jgi:hypothetical protein
MASNREKALLHIYADAAGLSDADYRQILKSAAGVASAADPALTWSGFRAAMARLEGALFDRADRGLCPDPINTCRHVRSRYYWRERARDTGFVNSRQYHVLTHLWTMLKERLPATQRADSYIVGIARQATGRAVDSIVSLTHSEAGLVIDAIRGRLHQLRNAA